jgi:DNA-binding MarR family transcriptional regulator
MTVTSGPGADDATDATSNADADGNAKGSIRSLEQELLTLFRQVRRGSASRARWIHPDLQLGGYAVLLWVAANDGARSADVASALGMDKGAVSRQIDQLERLGLLDRVSDPHDRRAQALVLTAAGSQGISALQDHGRIELRRRLATWSDAEIGQFAGLLRRYNESGAPDPARGPIGSGTDVVGSTTGGPTGRSQAG